VAQAGARNGETITVTALRDRSGQELADASRVTVPSADMARRLRRYFPNLSPTITPPEDDTAFMAPPPTKASGRLVVAVIGAIGIDKGLDVLLACARDAAARDLALDFRVIGITEDDEALHATGHAFVTGRYSEAEAEALIRAQGAHLALLPSVVPESWCYTLSLAWRAGLRCVVFDLGAQAERVRATGYGWCLPLGLPAEIINNTLMDCVNP
jgi:glycosyltransferase involved in cell wall biosynthesis